MTGSVLLHVQYLLGIGHLQRSLHIANALARLGIDVTLLSGGPPLGNAVGPMPNSRLVQLPPVHARDARFEIVDAAGCPLDDSLRALRRQAVLDTFAACTPDAVVIEGFPFARRAFRFELDPLIEAAQGSGARVICSLRDIVNLPDDPRRHREIVDRVCADFDAVLVHGDPKLFGLEASFPATSAIADQVIYTGYVVGNSFAGAERPGSASGEVLVSGGGGPAGFALMKAAIEARRAGCLADAPWRLLAGATLPEPQFAELAAAAPQGVVIDRFRSDFPSLLQACRVSVSQCGYNTALDVLAARVPAVFVPFAERRETEQRVRAERLAALGAAELVGHTELSPDRLAAAIERAERRQVVPIAVDTAGAQASAALISSMIQAGRTPRGGVVARPQHSIIVR